MYGHEENAVYLPPLTSTSLSRSFHTPIVNALTQRSVLLEAALRQLADKAKPLTDAAVLLVETLRSGHKVLVVGNGGSAAEAQHFAAELVGRFKRDRMPYAVISLATDTAILTAVANDYGYQDVFARQLRALGQPGDLLIAFSTSGESENVLRAAEVGHQCLLKVVAITGERPSRLEALSDVTVRVPCTDTAAAQELHMVVTHVLCDIAETYLSGQNEQRNIDLPLLTDAAKETPW
ncbi:MAG: SIS domain-containing protein [Ktedonobacteraceae bacterium]|nr:SIS domain-containing protein [Ktedonobacteraceae bacterium]